MQNPARWRNISFVFTITGVVACILLFMQLDSASNGWKALLAMYGLTATLFGGINTIMRQKDVRAQSGMARGEDLLASWVIDEFTWRDFVTLNEDLRAENDDRYNELDVPAVAVAQGFKVTIGKEAIDIAGQIFTLPRRGIPEVTSATLHESRVRPSYLELQLTYPASSGGASGTVRPRKYTLLRFPVANSAVRAARLAAAHYNGDTVGTPDFSHGAGDGTDAEDLSKCWSCGFETQKYRSQCPRCGSTLQSRRWSRRFGLMLTLCGAFITVLMGTVLYKVGPMLKQPGVEVNGASFSGSASQSFMVLGILGAVLAFGAIALCYGLWQMRTGRRSKKAFYIMVPIFLGLLLIVLLM
jgi:hypothetical protein